MTTSPVVSGFFRKRLSARGSELSETTRSRCSQHYVDYVGNKIFYFYHVRKKRFGQHEQILDPSRFFYLPYSYYDYKLYIY